MSEPPDRAGPVELDPRYAFSASAVLEKMPVSSAAGSQAGVTSDVLSGIGSTTSRTSSTPSSPSVSPERPSLEDALSLDDDSSEGSHQDGLLKRPEVVEQQQHQQQQPALFQQLQQQRGFLLPRSPARLFVHNAVVQSALSSVASSSAPVTLSDVLEQVSQSTDPKLLDQIEQDLQDQLQVLERIESDLVSEIVDEPQTYPADGLTVHDPVPEPVHADDEPCVEGQSDVPAVLEIAQSVDKVAEVIEEPIIATDQDIVIQEQVDVQQDGLLASSPDENVETVNRREWATTIDTSGHPAVIAQTGTIDSGVCELMAYGDGQHTDQYSDAYITAIDSISSSDFGDTPEPGNDCLVPLFSPCRLRHLLTDLTATCPLKNGQ